MIPDPQIQAAFSQSVAQDVHAAGLSLVLARTTPWPIDRWVARQTVGRIDPDGVATDVPSLPSAETHSFLVIVPIRFPEATPGYCCYVPACAPWGQERTFIKIFPWFFSTTTLAAAFARLHHPHYIEQLPEDDSSPLHPAVAFWATHSDRPEAFAFPQSPWVIAPIHARPMLYGAWRTVLSPRGRQFEMLAAGETPNTFVASTTHPPWFSRKVEELQFALRQLGPFGRFIAPAQYLPEPLEAQLHWDINPDPPHQLRVRRTVPHPPPIVSSPPVERGRIVPRATPSPYPVWRPHWFISRADPYGYVLWRPIADRHTFILGGYTDADQKWHAFQFANLSRALRFLGLRGLWGQRHPTLRIVLPLKSSKVTALPDGETPAPHWERDSTSRD